MNADQFRRAKDICAWLAKFEDPDNPDYPVDRIKAERWPEVCAAVEANPDLSAKTIAERLAPNRAAAPITNRDTAPERSGPPTPRAKARERVAEMKAQLRNVTKQPIPEKETA